MCTLGIPDTVLLSEYNKIYSGEKSYPTSSKHYQGFLYESTSQVLDTSLDHSVDR